MSLFAGNTILYIKSLKNPQKKPKKLIELKKCNKVVGYKINMQKSVAFLCTNNKLL